MTNDLARLIPRLKSLQRNMLQPENGSAHGICWQDNTEDASNRIKAILHAYLAGGGSKVKVFA